MLAKKCDLCGSFYDRYNEKENKNKPNGFCYLNLDDLGKFYKGPSIDCCPECMKKIQNFVEGLKNED